MQGELLLKKLLPGMGRKVNDSYEEFKQIYLTHPQGREDSKEIKENLMNRSCL